MPAILHSCHAFIPATPLYPLYLYTCHIPMSAIPIYSRIPIHATPLYSPQLYTCHTPIPAIPLYSHIPMPTIPLYPQCPYTRHIPPAEPGSCYDASKACVTIAREGNCQSYPYKSQCKRSCGFCG